MSRQDEIISAIVANPEILALATAEIVDTQTIADLLSIGKKKLAPTEIGAGTILAVLGTNGGAFLDTLVSIGQVNRNVYWTMDLIKQGRLRIDLEATRNSMIALAAAIPSIADAITALLTLGYVPDPYSEFEVRQAIFADDGSKRVQ